MIRVNEEPMKWHEGMTVQEVLNGMGYAWAHVTVTVNDTFVPEERWHDYPVPDSSEVRAIHLFHGG